MKLKFIEWFTKNNNGCSPAMEDDRSFVHEKTQHMFEAYLAGVAEGEAKCAALAAEMAWLKKFCKDAAFDADYEAELGMERGGFTDALNNIKTPATDSFLAEVRAQGLERLAKAWYAIANETAPGISISESSRLKYRQRADDVADFANEIRQETAQ